MLDDINTIETGVVSVGDTQFTLLENDSNQTDIIKSKVLDDTFTEVQIQEDGGCLEDTNMSQILLGLDDID